MKAWAEEEKITSTASEDFKKNITGGKRYVDKSMLLLPLLDVEHEVTFFLRPRRFGKTLTLSMIRYFVEDTRDETLNEENRSLFEGLKIMKAGERYTRQMTAYPVIHLTLQTIKDGSFESAWQLLRDLIGMLYDERRFLLQSPSLSPNDRRYFERILNGTDENGKEATRADYINSLMRLSEFLRKDAGKRVVVLIDEYDVPLENAYRNGYYQEMIEVIGPMLQNVLKSNSENLQFAVVTGCLRIAKEGIYTGLNNPEINTVLLTGRNDFFGFTEEEVRNLLSASGAGSHFEEVKDWYDGYRFGSTVIYNPWSVIKHIEALNRDPNSPPLAYWANTSGNHIIRELAERADDAVKDKVERAMQGERISFALRDNIVYDELYDDPDNVLNVMLSAGYLTAGSFDGETIQAYIPNREVHKIFRDQISSWFRSSLKTFDVQGLYLAMEQGNAGGIEEILTEEFLEAMSYYDTVEAFYHGVLLALMQVNRSFLCESNRESGAGRFDVMAKQRSKRDLAFVLEVKISEDDGTSFEDAQKAAAQIEEKGYVKNLQREGYKMILTYGLAFCRKRCRVVQGQTFEQRN